jgi:hypothetical protein
MEVGMTAVMAAPSMGRSLVSDDLFSRLTARIVKDQKLDRRLAERIMDQALAFLAACALNTDAPLSPGELVDIGWHTFILHTQDYAAFCDDVAGRFIHHVPTDDADTTAEPPSDMRPRTVDAIQTAGYRVDPELWAPPGADCNGCHTGCHHDPPPRPTATR